MEFTELSEVQKFEDTEWNRKKRDNSLAKRIKLNWETTIYTTLHRKLNIEQHESQ